MDSITDIFKTMRVTAFGQHRLEATAPWGLTQERQAQEKSRHSGSKTNSSPDVAHFAMLARGNCWLTVEGIAEQIPLTGGDCFLLARDTSIVMRDSPRTRPRSTFREMAANGDTVVAYGGGGAPTTIVCGSISFERASLKPITQLLPRFILIKADQANTPALSTTMQALTYELARQSPGSEVVANRLAEVLFIQILRAHIASESGRKQGWLRAIFDPQIGAALNAVHERVDTPWTVESLAETAGMSRSGFAARFKDLLGQTPLEYVTQWRMQKAIQLIKQREKKLVEIAQSVGYESNAAFSKAFKRVVGANPGEYLKRDSAA